MRYISLFSGIEAASVAWEPLGLEPVAFCEIDEFPSAVLAHHYPDVPNLGDITKVDWKEVIEEHGAVDLIVGGSPCQSFSVAGGRESLRGESRLMFEYVRALDEIRPRWFLWENVPGVLNTRDNAFAQLLGEVQKLGYGSLAWRVLDAQFFGVAQRRRRVFLVGRLGEGGSAAAVLFEPESLRGDNPSSREKRKALARAAGRGAASEGEGSLNAWDVQSKRVFSENGVAPTLSSGTNEGANIQPSVLQHADTIAFKYSAGAAARTMPTYNDGTCNTLTADYHAPAVAFAQNTRNEVRLQGGDGSVSGPIAASDSAKGQGVPFVMTNYGNEIAGTLTADALAVTVHDGSRWVVRRLTPVECERLQGFPDHYTDIPYRGKEHPPDTPRYKALGNSMAVPTMRWLGDRLQMVQEIMDEKES